MRSCLVADVAAAAAQARLITKFPLLDVGNSLLFVLDGERRFYDDMPGPKPGERQIVPVWSVGVSFSTWFSMATCQSSPTTI